MPNHYQWISEKHLTVIQNKLHSNFISGGDFPSNLRRIVNFWDVGSGLKCRKQHGFSSLGINLKSYKNTQSTIHT